jgi:hypothetical protein
MESVEWANLAQDRDKCLGVVNMDMNFLVPQNEKNLLAG